MEGGGGVEWQKGATMGEYRFICFLLVVLETQVFEDSRKSFSNEFTDPHYVCMHEVEI